MHRELLSHPHIGSYSACMLVAFLAGYLLARWRAVRLGISGRHIDNVVLLIPPISLFGARFFSWLFYQPAGTGFVEGMTMDGGGLVFYGGLVFGALTVVVYTLARRLPLREMVDPVAAPVVLGLAIGRVGCFLAGCCWGDLCADERTVASIQDPRVSYKVHTFATVSPPGFPLAVQFPSHSSAHQQHVRLKLIAQEAPRSLPVHPVQLYEAALALFLAFLLHRNFHKRRRPGDVFWAMLIGYGLIRFGVEFFRADNSAAYWGLTISQAISIAFVTVGGVALAWSSSFGWGGVRQPANLVKFN
jgi:phosphatidylglycerol---prolipoprotein diacylglyceryl transferase